LITTAQEGVTATFVGSTDPQPIEEQESTSSPDKGGSFSYTLLILGLLLIHRRNSNSGH